jgi:hypothetical protein
MSAPFLIHLRSEAASFKAISLRLSLPFIIVMRLGVNALSTQIVQVNSDSLIVANELGIESEFKRSAKDSSSEFSQVQIVLTSCLRVGRRSPESIESAAYFR